jgi:rod shape-determining protein MreC
VVGLAFLSLILITISFRSPTSGALHGIESAGATVLRPFEVGAERVARPFRDAYGYLAGLVHAKSENERLRDENNRLRQLALRGDVARQDADELRSALNFVEGPRFPQDYHPVNTRIISWAASEFDQQVVIYAGSAQGIRQDTPIVTRAGLVGRVTDLNGGSAQVTLITDETSAVLAFDPATGARGLVRHGQGQNSLILDRVPKEANVEHGDVIVTAGSKSKQFPSLYPKGILIGTVSSVGQSDSAPYKQIQIKPYVDFSSLDAVTALIPRKQAPKTP